MEYKKKVIIETKGGLFYLKRYNKLKSYGYKTLWTGEHKICLVKK